MNDPNKPGSVLKILDNFVVDLSYSIGLRENLYSQVRSSLDIALGDPAKGSQSLFGEERTIWGAAIARLHLKRGISVESKAELLAADVGA